MWDSYEPFQVFVKTTFDQQGKWRSYGGSSKRFDAGKLNTLTFNYQCGCLAKQSLISLCISTLLKVIRDLNDSGSECYDLDQSVDNLKLEIEMLKSRMDSMQSLLDSKGDQIHTTVSNLSNEIVLLQIDHEEEKFKKQNVRYRSKASPRRN